MLCKHRATERLNGLIEFQFLYLNYFFDELDSVSTPVSTPKLPSYAYSDIDYII